MNHPLKTFFIIFLATTSLTIFAAAPETKEAAEPAEEFVVYAPSVHAAFTKTGITDVVLKTVLFPFLFCQYTPRIRFDGISRKLSTTPDGNGFYAINHSDDLSHYSCRTGTVTRLTQAPIPASCIRESDAPVKSWVANNHLVTIAFYRNYLSRDDAWHVSATDLNPPHATRFHKLNSEYNHKKPRPTPAALLGAGLVICDKSKFALRDTSSLETLQRFNMPEEHSVCRTLKRVNEHQFVGQFHCYSSDWREESPNHFYHYDVGQPAPLHSFSTAHSWPRIFPCRDERTAIVSDRDGKIVHCTYDGIVQTDYTKTWNRINDEPGITIIPDGRSFLAHGPRRIAQFQFAHPTTPIEHATTNNVHKLAPISSTELLTQGCNITLLYLDNNTKPMLDFDTPPTRIKVTPQGFLAVHPGRITFWSKQSPIALAYQAGAEMPRLGAAAGSRAPTTAPSS